MKHRDPTSVLVVALAVLAPVACTSPSQSDAGPRRTDAGSNNTGVSRTTIGPEGGAASSLDGVLLMEIPAGAIGSPLEITITPAPSLSGAVGTVFDIGPDGTTFDKPVRLSLQLPADLGGAAAEDLALGRFVDDHWELLERGTIEGVSGVASGVTSHLSRYAITLWVDICGDSRCWGEQCYCPDDCGVIATGCGDGLCCGLEDCESCASDCGVCCGNGFVNEGEECDGDALPEDCRSLAFDGGELACTDSCRFDTSGCTGCGNGVKEDLEECDGSDFGGATCESLGRPAGVLRCSSECLIEDFCNCGNEQLDDGEECDGLELGGATCASRGFPGGTLACDSACRFDETGCFECAVDEDCTEAQQCVGDQCVDITSCIASPCTDVGAACTKEVTDACGAEGWCVFDEADLCAQCVCPP